MQLVIIAGGKGTRLGLTDIPKPMVKIGDKPLLEWQIEFAKKYGVDEVFILSGHLANVIVNYFGDGSKFGVKIHHVIEPYPLGTAGSLKLLEGKLNDRFLVFYGDVVMDFDIDSFIKFDKQYNSVGTAIVHPNDHPYDSDLLEIDKNNKVTKVLPKPHKEGEYYQNLVNAAVYIFSPEIFKYIEEGVSQDFGKHILPKIVQSGGLLVGYKTPEYIKDMGTADRFEAVKQDFLGGKVARLNLKNKRPCIFLDRDGVINKDMDSNPLCKDFELLPNVSDAIRMINKSNYLAVVVTNQPMIAKGFVSFDEVENTHKKMETLLGEEHAYLNGIYYCPHHPEKGFEGEIKELKIDCNCRKPHPGMLLKAAEDMNIDLANSWMIGDSFRDIIAGKNAGCKTISIGKDLDADWNADDLKHSVEYILKENIMSKKILITGGAGFIGSHLTDSLLAMGHSVTVLDNLSLGRLSNLEDAQKNANFTFIKGDILDKTALFKVFEEGKFDVVFHMAANSDIARSHANPDVDFGNTLSTTYNVLLAMKEFDVKNIVFASTSAIYGDTGVSVDENYGPLFPISHYGASKLASEAYISSFCENYGFKAWITRFPNVVGERATHGAIYDFINKLRKNPKELEVLGNGTQIKPYLYVKDLVEAIILVWSNTNDKINYFNLGVETRTRVSEMAEMVIEEMKLDAQIKYTGGNRGWVGDVPEFSYSLDKIHNLGWNPKLTSNEAVRKSIRYILDKDVALV